MPETILADQPLHLPIYQKILERKGSCTNLDLQTISNLVPAREGIEKDDPMVILYEYKNRLKDLDPDNLFYDSRSDYDFLNACRSFLIDAANWNIETFPHHTQKERDLCAVLNRLKTVPLSQKKMLEYKIPKDETVYILKSDHPIMQWPMIDALTNQGAIEAGSDVEQQRYFWSASTPRKAMECCARAIIDNNYPAGDVFIALANESERHLLAQVLESRDIPYTFLSDPGDNRIVTAFRLLCSYLMNKNLKSQTALLQYLFPAASRPLLNTLALFDEVRDLEGLEWKPNPVISKRDFERMKSDAAQAITWKKLLTEMESWDARSLEKASTLIQNAFDEPTEKDLRTFTLIMDQYALIKDEIQEDEDLSLFMHGLDAFEQAGGSKEYKGVLIGNRRQITALRPVCFFIDANAKNFPGVPMKSGVFDEAWYAKTEYISLQDRMKRARQYLYQALEQPQILYVINAQADAEGNTVDQSAELAEWMGMQPTFQYPKDYDVHQAPSFALSAKTALAACAPDSVMTFRPSTTRSLNSCPLQHLLSAGLKLHSPFSMKDGFSLSADLIPELMDLAPVLYGKPFSELSKQDQLALVSSAFDFAYSLFPHRSKELDALRLEALERARNITGLLDAGAKEMGVSFVQSSPEIDVSETVQEKEGDKDISLQLDVKGPLANSSSRKAVLSMLYNQQHNPDLTFSGLENAPAGTIAVPLGKGAMDARAFNLSYKGKAAPVMPEKLSKSGTEKAYYQEFFKENTLAQNLEPKDELSAYISSKVKTYQDASEDALNGARTMANLASKGDIRPDHKPTACAHCRFRAICRNAAREV